MTQHVVRAAERYHCWLTACSFHLQSHRLVNTSVMASDMYRSWVAFMEYHSSLVSLQIPLFATKWLEACNGCQRCCVSYNWRVLDHAAPLGHSSLSFDSNGCVYALGKLYSWVPRPWWFVFGPDMASCPGDCCWGHAASIDMVGSKHVT